MISFNISYEINNVTSFKLTLLIQFLMFIINNKFNFCQYFLSGLDETSVPEY